MRRMIAVAVAATLLAPLAAHAMDQRAWLIINGGSGRYDMADLNQDITDYNQANAGSASFPLIKNGMSIGGAIGFELPNHMNFGMGLDRLYARSKASDASGATDYQFNANGWRVFAEYAPRPIGSSSFRLGLGAGVVTESGKVTFSSPMLNPEEYKITGAAPLYEGYAGGDVWATPHFAITGAVGYRYAKLSKIEIDGGSLIGNNGEPTGVDYSGVYARFGVKLAGKASDE
jgi:hypothetical protein